MLRKSETIFNLLSAPGGGRISPDAERPPRCYRSDAGALYECLNGKPVLINFSESVIERERLFATAADSTVARRKKNSVFRRLAHRFALSEAQTRENIRVFQKELKNFDDAVPVILIIGGGSVGRGIEELYETSDVELVAFDVYDSPHVQLLADAHALPFDSGIFAGVVVQAVLEHVVDPAQCVREIQRVLRKDGLVYAETPFMQHVHEGPYDFTRYTESGHRYLFRNFERIASGSLGGPATQFVWSVDYLIRSLFRSRIAGKAAKLALGWMQVLDYWVAEPYRVDAASGVYFLGRKSDRPVSCQQIIGHYLGAQR